METKESFAKLLDSSWLTFRQQLLEAFPDEMEMSNAPSMKSLKVDHRGSNKTRDQSVSEITEIDEDVYLASSTPQILQSALKTMDTADALQTAQRLRVRLGAISASKLVSGKSLHEAVAALGLTRFSEEDMNEFVNTLADFIQLDFHADPQHRQSSHSGTFEQDLHFGEPVWSWPQPHASLRKSIQNVTTPSLLARKTYNVVPAQALMELFLAKDEGIQRRLFGLRLLTQYHAMKEILLAGDTNRLVAELTFVRINDLATPPEPTHPLMYIEPFVGILILANGVMIGFQTDPLYEHWEGWIWFELSFSLILIVEICLRMHLLHCRGYWCGAERLWNWFDVLLCAAGVTDVLVQLIPDSNTDMSGTSLLRFCRLIRLARIVKVFRLRFMKDLRLMVKGWIAGIRTLGLAFTLLFAVLYVISGFAAMTVGKHPLIDDGETQLRKYFETIPKTMFTAFRCFTGECVNDQGHSITSILAERFGVLFEISFVASYMLVTMGIFNVILAVYVDITMKAAKENEAATAEQYARESIRIARTTRELLKKFAAAHRDFMMMDNFDALEVAKDFNPTPAVFTDDDVHEQIEISKELFLVVIQDHKIQMLMDELDLPPDRANLFEVIDADGSGTLHITELVQGLLKIRGEINKSDTVASLLATKAVQRIVEEMRMETFEKFEALQGVIRAELGHALEDRDRRYTMPSDPLEPPEQPPPSPPVDFALMLPAPPTPAPRASVSSMDADLAFMPAELHDLGV